MPDAGTADRFSVVITDPGEMKIQAIKTVREITGLGLEEARDLVDGVPSVIKDDLSDEEARSLAEKLRGAGMTVEVRPR
jgi:large subunit ribosomal protein L7/L12